MDENSFDLRTSLERVLACLDAAVETIDADVDAATDDLLAARLLVASALTILGPTASETSISSPSGRRSEPSPPQCNEGDQQTASGWGCNDVDRCP